MTQRMKRVVVTTGLREADIRPPALMSEFKRLSIQDALDFFADPECRVEIACPACGGGNARAVFNKQDFVYRECAECRSVYVSPRPNAETLARYYANSRASRFRVEHFSRDTAKARRYHLLRSHAEWMSQIADELDLPTPRSYADVETHSPEIFEEVAALSTFTVFFSVNPLLPVPHKEGCNVQSTEWPQCRVTAISAFEKIEHQFAPEILLKKMADALVPGGVLFFTTRTISGFDLQVLWDKTPYLFVPEHINLLSIEGITRLLERLGLRLIELSTPGQLDVELVRHACRHDPSIQLPKFIDYLLNHRDALAHEDFQEFLQKHRLSSHVRVAARKV